MLAVKIRKCSSLKGFYFGVEEKSIKISQYADDALVFLNDKDEMCAALNVVSQFGHFSGTKLNLSKCEGLWLGTLKHKQNNCQMFGIKWPRAIKCLGIYIGHDSELNTNLNWFEKLDKIDQLLLAWCKRDLSIYGRILVVKTFAISQLVQVASLLPVPQGFVLRLNKMLFSFLWRGTEKVKRLKIIRNSAEGGINMIDVHSMFMALKAVWIYRISTCDATVFSWVQVANHFIGRIANIDNIKRFSLDSKTLFPAIDNMHLFYKEVLLGYSYANAESYESFCNTILTQPLWGNRFINVNHKKKKSALLLRNWIRSGVNNVGDLKYINGDLDEAYVYTIIQNQTNIHAEIMMMKKALAPFRRLLVQSQHDYRCNIPVGKMMKSKDAYLRLIYIKCNDISTKDMCPIVSELCNEMEVTVEDVFKNQLCSQIETKLKEFNFKVMYNILPCNVNLVKWRIKNSDTCDICDSQQTIKHLLFECHRASYIWNVIADVFHIDIMFGNIVCGLGEFDSHLCHTITLLSFLLYKEWLIHSLDGKRRCFNFPFHFFIGELQLRDKIYKCSGHHDHNLTPIIQRLEEMSNE